MLQSSITLLDDIHSAHAPQMGRDAPGYRNHTYRVANFCLALSSIDGESTSEGEARVEKVAIAVAMHDIGIWTDDTFDYIEPSIHQATSFLSRTGRSPWIPEISAMIREHHKIAPVRSGSTPLVEAFRRADLIDVTWGLFSFGLPRALLRETFSAWPSAGFHRRLVELTMKRLAKHPLSPLPMVHL